MTRYTKHAGSGHNELSIGNAFRFVAVVLGLVLSMQLASAQSRREFHRVFEVSLADSVILDVQLSRGSLEIAYGREGQVSITASTNNESSKALSEDPFTNHLIVSVNGNHLEIRDVPDVPADPDYNFAYRIDVPHRTEVRSFVQRGSETINGVAGPVEARTEDGGIKISYVSQTVRARTEAGNIDVQVVGGPVEAKAKRGNISCVRCLQGVDVETEDGDISLAVIGPSRANVRRGTGGIKVGGIRGSFIGSTAAGELYVRAVPHSDWQLSSVSGSVRIELPPAAKFEIEASTSSGEFIVKRNDFDTPEKQSHHLVRKVNGGGMHIEIHTESGLISIG